MPSQALRDQAIEDLARWDAATRAAGDAGFVPVGELTGQIGGWEPAVGDNNKIALLTGHVVAVAVLPSGPVPDGDITWSSGTRVSVQLISADTALQQLTSSVESSTDCNGCAPLQVTGAALATTRIQTGRGMAQVPACVFTLAGTKVRITRLAVLPSQVVTVTPPPWDPNAPGSGLSIEKASLARDGVSLTVRFVGAPDPASKPCGVDYAAEVVESSTAVVVIITEHPYSALSQTADAGAGSGDANQGCAAAGAERTAVTTLSQPLAERAVLEVRQGLPVPVSTA
jgi:hypothetical protein